MRTFLLLLVPGAIALAGCMSSSPPELNDAHAAFDRLQQGPASQVDPAEVHAAQEQLAVADRSFQDHGASQETRDLAYAAKRRAELAEVRAQTALAAKQQSDALAQLGQLKEQQARLTSAELSTTRQELATSEHEKADAERRAQQAATDLARIASVKQEARGMVITIPGGVLFESAKYELLPQAQVKLSQVADVLTKQDKDSNILVQGYTDSQGGQSFNQLLSQHRAEAVRAYLVSHGIASDRVTAQGFGPANPIADNASAEGRADNRRVEIIVQTKGGASSTGQ